MEDREMDDYVDMRGFVKKMEAKRLAYMMLFFWFLNIAIYTVLFMVVESLTIGYAFMIALSPIALTPVLVFGIWKVKRWALNLSYVVFGIALFNGVMSTSIYQVIVSAIIIYLLYKKRKIFD